MHHAQRWEAVQNGGYRGFSGSFQSIAPSYATFDAGQKVKGSLNDAEVARLCICQPASHPSRAHRREAVKQDKPRFGQYSTRQRQPKNESIVVTQSNLSRLHIEDRTIALTNSPAPSSHRVSRSSRQVYSEHQELSTIHGLLGRHSSDERPAPYAPCLLLTHGNLVSLPPDRADSHGSMPQSL